VVVLDSGLLGVGFGGGGKSGVILGVICIAASLIWFLSGLFRG
jgi:hypothetical protein